MLGAGVQTVTSDHDGYPRRLRGPSAPVLRVVGTLVDRPRAVALVGSRAASREVGQRAFALAHHAAARGLAVVSGGAIGVDAAAHRGANAGGGGTVVVLGSGIAVPYPDRNRGLFAEVIACGGAVVSMFPDRAEPRPGHFVRRNHVIAALVDLVVVVGAERGSGSLHTARAAVGLGRRIAAVPGTPGTDALVAAGAGLVEHGEDLERALEGAARRPVLRPLDDHEAAIVAALDPLRPRTAGEVAEAAGLRLPIVLAALADLELADWVVPAAGGYVCFREPGASCAAPTPDRAG